MAADAWCAAFVAPKTKDSPTITDAVVQRLAKGSRRARDCRYVASMRDQYRFLNLHLAFPRVFRVSEDLDPDGEGPGWEGGFDVVLGNPPWEKVQFIGQGVLCRTGTGHRGACRGQAQASYCRVRNERPGVVGRFRAALRQADVESHLIRHSGRYPLCGQGEDQYLCRLCRGHPRRPFGEWPPRYHRANRYSDR